MSKSTRNFLMILFLALLIGLLLAVGQIVPIYLYTLVGDAPATLNSLRHQMNEVDTNAFLLAITAIGSTLLLIPIIFAIAKLLKRELTIKEYFALNSFSKKDFFVWMSIAVLILVGQHYILEMSGIKSIPDSMLKITYPSDFSKFLLVFGVAFMAPILEEVIFRGFLLKSFAHTFIGPDLAIVFTSLVWAIIHFQYEFIYLFIIFIIGIILGYARAFTNSLYIPILMHILFNFVAAIELYVVKGIL